MDNKCSHCEKELVVKRKISIWSWLLVIATYGLWGIVIYYKYKKYCSSCGFLVVEDEPKVKSRVPILLGCLVLAACAVPFIASVLYPDGQIPRNNRNREAQQDFTVACGDSLGCYINDGRFFSQAQTSCEYAIEQQANYQSRWSGFTGQSRFPSTSWANREQLIIGLGGSSVEFQNGFGAWQQMAYNCRVDAKTGIAISANVLGR